VFDERPDLPRVVQFLMAAARRLGLEARVLDGEHGYLFEISNGTRRVALVGGLSPLNGAMGARLAGDKFYTKLLLSERGLRVADGVRCLAPGAFAAPELEAASGAGAGLEFAARHGYPLIVKPNARSHGRKVAEVGDRTDLLEAISDAWSIDPVALVEERVAGTDFRLDFLDGEYLLGYRRRAVALVGDGRATLRELTAGEDPRTADETFWRRIDDDPAWRERVVARGLGPGSVLPAGERIVLGGAVLNLHRWAVGEPLDAIPEDWLAFCLGIGAALGLRFFGVDLKAPELGAPPAEITVLEVNASPLLLGMAEMGHAERAMAAQMKVLEAVIGKS